MQEKHRKLASVALFVAGALMAGSVVPDGVTFYSLAGVCVMLAGIAFWLDL